MLYPTGVLPITIGATSYHRTTREIGTAFTRPRRETVIRSRVLLAAALLRFARALCGTLPSPPAATSGRVALLRPADERGVFEKPGERLERGTTCKLIDICSASPPGDRRWIISITRPGTRAVALATSISGWIIFLYQNCQFFTGRPHSVASHHFFDQNRC
jgi:hypothetical protein